MSRADDGSQGAGAAWYRREGESAKAYQALMYYCQLGPERSLRQVAARRDCNLSLVKRWSSRHQWGVRARAWDAEQVRMEETVREEHRYDLVARQAEDAELLRKLFRAVVKKLVRRDPGTGELTLDPSLTVRDAVQFCRSAAQIERGLDGGRQMAEELTEAQKSEYLTELVMELIENGKGYRD